MTSMVDVSERGDRLAQLVALKKKLAEALDDCDSKRDLASLSRQYRETLREIEELEKDDDDLDEIARILANRKPGADAPGRA